MKNVIETKIISLLKLGPQKTENLAKALYPVGRGCGRGRKQKIYANIYHLRKKGYNIKLIAGKYHLISKVKN
jgi:biotin operon repressor